MSIKSRLDLNTYVDTYFDANGEQLITGPILNAWAANINDSAINKLGDTGILGVLTYSSLFTLSNDGDLVYKKYVDDVLASISIPWVNITGTPTTLLGYGITDAYTKTATDAKYVQIGGDLSGTVTSPQVAKLLGNTIPSNAVGFLHNDGAGVLAWQSAGTGTVTSVGLSLPGIFSVSGSPVTTTGTLTAALANQNQNSFFAGPASGGAGTPTFRGIGNGDLIAINIYDYALTVSAAKTSNFTANSNEISPVDTTSGAITATLPTGPADKTRIVVKMVIQGSTNIVTINTGGSDVFNKTGGGTALTLKTLNQGVNLQYNSAGAIWYVVSDDLSLAALDLRYAPIGITGTVTNVTSADGNATIATNTTTPVITIVSAPKLQTARTINTVSFDGTSNIIVTAAAGTLTGATLNAMVITSSLTSVGILTTGTWNASVVAGQYGGTGIANTGKTITLGGNLATTGAFNATFALPLTGTWTLPNNATDTLAGLGTTQNFTGVNVFVPAARTSGSGSYFSILTPADTTLTTSAESIGIRIGGDASAATVTRQWATGNITTQRENLFIAPTYAFSGASVISDAATLSLSGAPIAGTNATFTRSYALWIQSGNLRVDGKITSRGGSGLSVGSEDAQAIQLQTNGTARLLISSTGQRTSSSAAVNNTWLIYNQGASASGTSAGLVWTAAAHTGQTASVELSDINYNFARIITFQTGAIATNRAFRIQAPTYAFSGASVITNAATLSLSGAPIAGTNGTITNSYALWIESGLSRFDGAVFIKGFTDASSAAAGYVGETILSIQSTYQNYSTTATYQNVVSVTLSAGDWDIYAFGTLSSNGATITAASNAIFVISTATASVTGGVEGATISYIPQSTLIGTSKESIGSMITTVSISSPTTYYLNTQATFTLGNPQFVGSLIAKRRR